MVPEAIAYLLGLATLPALTGLGYAHVKLVMRDGTTKRECYICGYTTGRERPIVRWVKWRWHDITRGWRTWHRAGVDEYQRRWQLGKYADTSSAGEEQR